MEQEERRNFIRENLRELTSSTIIEPEFVVSLLALNLIKDSESNLLLDTKTPNVTKAIKLYSHTMNRWDQSQFESFKEILKETGNKAAIKILTAKPVKLLGAQTSSLCNSSEYRNKDDCMTTITNRPVGFGGEIACTETSSNLAPSLESLRKIKVCIQILGGRQFDIQEVEIEHLVNELKQKIQRNAGVSVDDQTLIYLGQELIDNTYLCEYNLVDGCAINMIPRSVGGMPRRCSKEVLFDTALPNKSTKAMTVIIKDLEGRLYNIPGILAEQNVNKLKQKIYAFTGVCSADQTLLYLGQELAEDTKIFEYGVVDGCMINMVHRSVGGGSGSTSKEKVFNDASKVSNTKSMTVVIQDLEAQQYDISGVMAQQEVNKLKKKIGGFLGISPADQTLMFLGQELVDDTHLCEYGIVEGCMINLVHRSVGGGGGSDYTEKQFNDASPVANKKFMRVVIQDLEGRQYDIPGVLAQHKVNQLKRKIHGFTGVSPGDQTLLYMGQELVNDTYLSEYCLLDRGMINLVHRHVECGGISPPTEPVFSLVSRSKSLGSMKVTIQDHHGREYDIELIEGEQSVSELKQKICEFTGFLPADQTLMYLEQELLDGSNLCEYDIDNAVANEGKSASSEIVSNLTSSAKSPIKNRVIIWDLDGREHDAFETGAEDSVNNLKEKIYGITGISSSDQTIMYSGQELLDDTILSKRIISDECLIKMVHRPAGYGHKKAYNDTLFETTSSSRSPLSMKVTIQDLEGRQYDVGLIEAEQNVNELKKKIYWLTATLPFDQTLMYLGQELEDDTLVSEYGVVDGCMINMIQRSIGGGGRIPRAEIILFVDE